MDAAARRPRVPFAALVSLTVGAIAAAFGLVAPLALWTIEPTQLPSPFSEQNQDAETLIFLFSFVVALPAGLLAVPRLTDRIAPGFAGLLAAFATALLLSLAVLLKLSERLPWGGGIDVLFALSAAWFVLVGAILALTARADAPPPARAGGWERALWLLALGMAAPLALSFAELDSLSVPVLAVGVVLAALPAAMVGTRLPRIPRAAGIGWDGVAVALLILAVTNLVIFTPEDPGAATETTIIQFHQNFFLGPANQVLGGGAMLIDTLSQYGVGSIYFLDAWFLVVPIGNGTLGLLDGALSGAVFAAAYLIMRAAGVGRLLASAAMTVAVVVLVLNLVYPAGALLQHGAIRFGLPITVIAAAMIGVRYPQRARLALGLQLLFVGISSIWALEAFGYTLITVAGLIALEVGLAPERRMRLLALRLGAVLAACVIAHLLFAAATLAATGQLPDWGLYLTTLREFLVGGIGDLNYDFVPWSGGIATAMILVASTAAVVLMVRRRADLAREQKPAIVALSGSTAYGIALFTYFVNRSSDHILPYVSLPVLMVVTLWLSTVLRPSPAAGTPVAIRRAALGAAGVLAAVLVALAWSNVGTRFSQSALAYIAPGGRSLEEGLERLWDPPELASGAREGERLLREYMPGEEESLVLTSADLGIEILMETERINRIPLSDPWEDSLVPSHHLDQIHAAVAGIEEGDRALLDQAALRVIQGFERDPDSGEIGEATIVPSGIAYLQEESLREIATRFTLRRIAGGGDGMFVAELVRRADVGS